MNTIPDILDELYQRPLHKVDFPLIKGGHGRTLTPEELKEISTEMDDAEDIKHSQANAAALFHGSV